MRWWGGMHAMWRAPIDPDPWAPETTLPPAVVTVVAPPGVAVRVRTEAPPHRPPQKFTYEYRQAE